MAIGAWHIMREKTSVRPDTTAQEIAHKIISSGLPGLPVVSDTMEVLGMVTEHHILGAIGEGLDLEKIPAADLMMTSPVTADMHTSPDDLIRMMLVNNCCAVLPIVNNKKYVGVVSRHMLMEVYTSPHYSRFAQKDRKGPFLCL
jgi:predicted transcriptional regulator